jgi:hypothetical protein
MSLFLNQDLTNGCRDRGFGAAPDIPVTRRHFEFLSRIQ